MFLKTKWLVLTLFYYFFDGTFSAFVQPLHGTWSVKDVDNIYSLSATVPGSIYADLMNNQIIGDIYFGNNDIDTRWVSKLDWIYTKEFTVNSEILNQNNINLIMEGIDTFATIYLNGIEVAYTKNMFLRYIYDVKSYLKEGPNNITMIFYSPVNKARELFNKHTNYVGLPQCVEDSYNGECHVNFIRKMQSSFAWDWGPAFPSMGIWKPIFLEAYNFSVIRDVTIEIIHDTATDMWDVDVNAYLAGNNGNNNFNGTLIISLETENDTISNEYQVILSPNGTTQHANVSIPKHHVKAWWPNGYGDQVLYKFNVTFISQDGSETSEKVIRVGFRTIELIQDDVGNGTTFYFKVNSVPIFAKGTNIIPISMLPEQLQNETQWRFLFQSAKEVNMNMVRNWGGGTYKPDLFYELADEYGILIWQDFMFACAMYPVEEEFLENVRQEVEGTVKRVQHHPSIALWAANNENEAALAYNWYGTDINFNLYKADYIKLYVETVAPEVFLYDKSKPFTTSSPTNGVKSVQQGFIGTLPECSQYGDTHYYDYSVDSWDADTFPRTKFASEYGFESIPSLYTMRTATNNSDDLHIFSKFMINRQHHYGAEGYNQMLFLIKERLRLPPVDSDNFIPTFIYYSQIQQAMAVKLQSEFYRAMQNTLFEDGSGLSMGALYWQLNDVWAAPTWAGIDSQNRWKILHYFAKDFFAPVLVTGYLARTGNLQIYLVSDKVDTIPNVTVTIKVQNWMTFNPITEEKIKLDMQPLRSTLVSSFFVDDYLARNGCGTIGSASKHCFLYLTVNDPYSAIAPDNYVFPIPLKDAIIPAPNLQIVSVDPVSSDGTEYDVSLTTDHISLFVWLETGDVLGKFSRNGFLMTAPSTTVRFYAYQPTTLDQVKKSISVTNLMDEQYL